MDPQIKEIVEDITPAQAKRLLIILSRMNLEEFPLTLTDFQDLVINT